MDFKVIVVEDLQLSFFYWDGRLVFIVQEVKNSNPLVNLVLFSLDDNSIPFQIIHLVMLMLLLHFFLVFSSEIDFIFDFQAPLLKLTVLGNLLNCLFILFRNDVLKYHLLGADFLLFDLLLHLLDGIFVLFQVLFMLLVEFAG